MKRRANKGGVSPDVAIDAMAAKWLGVREAGATAEQEAEFAAWLNADSRHREAYTALEAISRRLDPLRALRPAGDSSPDPDLPLPVARRNVRRGHRRIVVFAFPFAAAAALALAWLGPWARAPIDYSDVAVTEVGGSRQLTLPDKSVIDLNTDTQLTVSFSATERRIVLTRGEAHFAAAKDATRPFVVQVGDVTFRAIGTAFIVRLLEAEVEVLVTEGRIGVENAARMKSASDERPSSPPAEIVPAGHRAVVAVAPDVSDIQPVKVVVSPVSIAEVSQRLAWQKRRLEFEPTALRHIVSEFNRYSRHRLVIVDPEVAALNIGGSFRAGDVEALVRLLESNFEIRAEKRDDETLLHKR